MKRGTFTQVDGNVPDHKKPQLNLRLPLGHKETKLKTLKKYSLLLFAVGLLSNGFAADAQVPNREVRAGDRIPPRNPVTPPEPPANLMTGTISNSVFGNEIAGAFLGTRLQISTSASGEPLIFKGGGGAPTPPSKWAALRKELLEGCIDDPNPEQCLEMVRETLEKIRNKPNQTSYYSYVRWGPILKEHKPDIKDQILFIPLITKDLPGNGKLTFLINNLHTVVNSGPYIFSAEIGDGGLNFMVEFKSDDPTIECVGSTLCPGNIKITSSRLSIKLRKLTVTPEGKLSFNDAVVTFDGEISFTGALSVADSVADLKTKLKDLVESKIREQLFSKDVKEGFADVMGDFVRGHLPGGGRKLTIPVRFYSVGVAGSDLIVKYTKPQRRS